MGLKIPPRGKSYRVNVYRSFPLEYSAKVLNLFSSLWGAGFDFTYTDYDPALSQLKSLPPGDVDIFWIDWRIQAQNHTPSESTEWCLERIGTLRKGGGRPLLVNNWPLDGDWVDHSESAFKQRNWTQTFNPLLAEKISI